MSKKKKPKIRGAIWFGYIIVLLFSSCESEKVVEERVKIARVGNVYLYEEGILKNLPEELNQEDSLFFTEQHIQNWIEEQIVLQKAEEVLPEDAKDVEDRLEKYRKSLVIYAYEQKFIKERLDTVVSLSEIEVYYNSHQDDFMLKDYIVKALYLKLLKGTPDVEKVKHLYKLTKKTDTLGIRNYADVYAVKFHFEPEQWIFFSDILKEIPLQDVNTVYFIRKKKKVMFEDEEFIYFVNITDFMLKDAISPLGFETEKIKTIILNLRTIDLRNKLRENLYNDAKKAQQIETYQ